MGKKKKILKNKKKNFLVHCKQNCLCKHLPLSEVKKKKNLKSYRLMPRFEKCENEGVITPKSPKNP